jgi:hypothetical protein
MKDKGKKGRGEAKRARGRNRELRSGKIEIKNKIRQRPDKAR